MHDKYMIVWGICLNWYDFNTHWFTKSEGGTLAMSSCLILETISNLDHTKDGKNLRNQGYIDTVCVEITTPLSVWFYIGRIPCKKGNER